MVINLKNVFLLILFFFIIITFPKTVYVQEKLADKVKRNKDLPIKKETKQINEKLYYTFTFNDEIMPDYTVIKKSFGEFKYGNNSIKIRFSERVLIFNNQQKFDISINTLDCLENLLNIAMHSDNYENFKPLFESKNKIGLFLTKDKNSETIIFSFGDPTSQIKVTLTPRETVLFEEFVDKAKQALSKGLTDRE